MRVGEKIEVSAPIDRVWEEAYQETRPVNVAGAWLLRLSAAAGGLSGLWVCRRLLMRGRR